jgi:hypothetical protein
VVTAAERAVVLTEPGGAGALRQAQGRLPGTEQTAAALKTLLDHFELKTDVIAADRLQQGALSRYRYAFFLAAGESEKARDAFLGELPGYPGTVIWVGPGVETLGAEAAQKLGLSSSSAPSGEPQADEWLVAYADQQHSERIAVPAVVARPAERAATAAGGLAAVKQETKALALARRDKASRPFIIGSDRLWYAAAGPSLGAEHVWTMCIWADALHEMLGIAHRRERRLVACLRDVPVWAAERQAVDAARPMLAAGLPVAVIHYTQMKGAALADRPAAVQGMREIEGMGGVLVLAADRELNAREEFRLAWEVGLHPVAWAGPEGRDNPFRLRIADAQRSPPYAAGGLLPAPIKISDAGYIADADLARLKMQSVVRDGVALLSFGLWAPRDPFLSFFRAREAEGWRRADLRDLGVLVTDSRRLVTSASTEVAVSWNTHIRQTRFESDWRVAAEEVLPARSASAELTVAPTDRGVVVLEPVAEIKPRPFLTGVTLDPWTYKWSGLPPRVLAESLAERYARNGVNTVFFYAYNVEEGAAYWTRYWGASVSDWGRQDLLRYVLEACHARHLRVVAWMYSGRDRGMWGHHPEWRERTKDGKDFSPLRLHATYFLCPRNPEVRQWYSGLVRDLGRRYPALDGIELCEPLVNWSGDIACYCQVCNQGFASAYPGKPTGGPEWRRYRAEGLTEFLGECLAAVAENNIDSYLMTICDAWSNGALLTPKQQMEQSGFDLDAVLDGPYPPDWVNIEVIWQQWAAIYGTEFFNYQWAEDTAERVKRRIDGRARMLVHVELSDFGNQHMTPEKMATTIRYVAGAHPDGIECYHSAALDRNSAWAVLKQAYEAAE